MSWSKSMDDLPTQLIYDMLSRSTSQDRKAFARTSSYHRSVVDKFETNRLMTAIFRDRDSIVELEKYGHLTLLGKDVTRLFDGDKESSKHAALVIPGLKVKEGKSATDFKKLVMSAFKSTFDEAEFCFEFAGLNLQLNIDQLLGFPMILYESRFVHANGDRPTPGIQFTTGKYGIQKLETKSFESLSIVTVEDKMLTLHDYGKRDLVRANKLTEEPWLREISCALMRDLQPTT